MHRLDERADGPDERETNTSRVGDGRDGFGGDLTNSHVDVRWCFVDIPGSSDRGGGGGWSVGVARFAAATEQANLLTTDL